MIEHEKVLILGASGFVGQGLVQTMLEAHYNVVPVVHHPDNSLPIPAQTLDITSQQQIHDLFHRERPDIVINAAGVIGFNPCEREKERAFAANVTGVIYVLNEAETYNPLYIQISTDAVFDGSQGNYGENDVRNPSTVYGYTKKLAEDATDHSCMPHIIARTSVVFGKYHYAQRGQRFIDSVIDHLRKNKEFPALTDTVNSPTFLGDLTHGILYLIRKQAQGVFHIAGPEVLSKYQLAVTIARSLQLNEALVTPAESTNLPPALQLYPKNTSLDISRLHDQGYYPHLVLESLKNYSMS